MICYRFTQEKYKDDLSGEGARLYGGRWNSKGSPMLYATEHISLGVLEIMVNKRVMTPEQEPFNLITMEIPYDAVKLIKSTSLKKNWHKDFEYTQFIGDHFLMDKTFWILKVPSAVIPEEYNFLINPFHPEFNQLNVIRNEIYGIDQRLWK